MSSKKLKRKAILVVTALLVIIALAGSASAAENAWVNDTAPSAVAPGRACKVGA